MKGVGIAPKFDTATEYSFDWYTSVMFDISSEDLEVTHLPIQQAIRHNVESAIYEVNPELVVFYDHGSEDRLWGNDHSPCIDNGNCHRLKGRYLYTLACLYGKEGAHVAVEKGLLGAWAYTEEWGFFIDESEKAFKEQANIGLLALARDGLSVEEAKSSYIKCSNYWRDYYVEGDGKMNPNAAWIAARLVKNRDILTTPGQNIRLMDIPTPPLTDPPEEEVPECRWSRLALFLFGSKGLAFLRRARDIFASFH